MCEFLPLFKGGESCSRTRLVLGFAHKDWMQKQTHSCNLTLPDKRMRVRDSTEEVQKDACTRTYELEIYKGRWSYYS